MPESTIGDRTGIEYLKDTFKIGYDAYIASKEEASTVWDLYHNRHYTTDQLNILETRGQPAETFNVVKLFSRLLIGYYSTVINKVQCLPVGMEDAITTALLNDVIDHSLRDNNFIEEGEKVKLSGLLTGAMCAYVEIQPTGETDEFNRPLNKVVLEYVPEDEIILDPMCKRVDRTDARWIHRYKWLSEEAVLSIFGAEAMKDMVEYYNFTDSPEADYEVFHSNVFVGRYRMHNNYLVVHTIVEDENGDRWSIFWHDEMILEKKKLTHKEIKFPYRVVLLHDSDEIEYYGIFREVIESQKAINQALTKLQLMINTQKAFVEEGAVESIADFTNAFNRVSAVIPVQKLDGVRLENMSREAQEQYVVIDKCFDRIQRTLGINDSFLGMAFASDSGRKVKLQQNQTIIALRYFTARLETFYRLLGWDIAKLIKQYYTATQSIRIADDYSGHRWATLNQPEVIFTGVFDQQGMPIMEPHMVQITDPATGEPMVDEDGNYVIAPMSTEETEVMFTNVDIEIISTAYNDEDEKNQLLLETVLSGPTGQLLAQVNPAGFFKASGLSLQSVKTKHSLEITEIFMQTAQMLGENQQAQQEASLMAQGQPSRLSQQPKSQELRLPQNTNEGA